MWQYAPSDGHVARNLISAFKELGWQQTAEVRISVPVSTNVLKLFTNTHTQKYMTGLRRTFPGADLDSPLSVVHSNVSFSFTEKTGAYMSVYYAVSGKATLLNKEE